MSGDLSTSEWSAVRVLETARSLKLIPDYPYSEVWALAAVGTVNSPEIRRLESEAEALIWHNQEMSNVRRSLLWLVRDFCRTVQAPPPDKGRFRLNLVHSLGEHVLLEVLAQLPDAKVREILETACG